MTQLLKVRGNFVSWKGRNVGIIRRLNSSSVNIDVEFKLTTSGFLMVQDSSLVAIGQRERYAWQAQECDPDERFDQMSNNSLNEHNNLDTIVPERFLVNTIQLLEKTFFQNYGKSLLKQHSQISNVQRRIHRFRAAGEDGLLTLACEMNKYLIEWIQPSSLHSILDTTIKKGKTLKLLEHFLKYENRYENASEIIAPLFAINDLRNLHSHLRPNDHREEEYFRIIGVNRSTPLVHQGAEMIDRVATVWSKFIPNRYPIDQQIGQ